MKHHVVLKLVRPIRREVPDWIDFICDKSQIVESLDPAVDRVMDDAGLAFWVTQEFRRSGPTWSDDERRHGLDRTYRLILQRDIEQLPPGLIDRLAALPVVESASALTVSDAPLPPVARQASLPAPNRAADLIHLGYAQAITRGSPQVKIAVLDTGVNLSHRELAGKLLKGADFVDLNGLDTADFIGDITGYDEVPEDEVGHGTHVSGIIAAAGLKMDEGVAPDCRILPVRVLASMKSGDHVVGAGITDNINAGIKWAVDHGADVINMSLGIKNTGGGLPHEDVIKYALSKNVTVVAASGNDGTDERYYPGALPGVIAVGAVDGNGDVTSFTSYGANIFCVAPGLNIYSSFAENTYAVASGTSQASPFVCGAVGLMKSFALEQGRTLSNDEIQHVLKHTSDKINSRLRDEHAGYGLLNLADGFKLLGHLLN